MKVTVYDVEQPDRKLDGQYSIDTTLGLPAVGDDIHLRARDYHDHFYVTAQIRRRVWIYSDNAPTAPEVQLWVQRHPK